MSDQELRDKLANEYQEPLHPAWPGEQNEAFKAGWDAARANDALNLNTMGLEASVKGTVERLELERDQLRAEVERLQSEFLEKSFKDDMFKLNRSLEKELEAERDEHFITKRDLKAEVEQISKELKRFYALPAKHSEVIAENTQLRAAAEKLAEALSFSLDGLAMWRKYGSPGNIAEVEERTRQALAEYREKFSK